MGLRVPLGTVLERQAERRGDNPFLTIVDDDTRLTYREFNELVNRAAHGLAGLGVTKGDYVGVMLRNALEPLVVSYALKKLGAIEVAINYDFRGPGLARMLNLTRHPLLLTETGLLEPLRQIAGELTDLTTLVVKGDLSAVDVELGDRKVIPFETILSDRTDNPGVAVRDVDLALVLFSSGTTGLSKGQLSTHRFAVRTAEGVANNYGLTEDDVVYTPWPLHHLGAAIAEFVPALLTGGQVVLRGKLSVSRYWDEVRRYGATWCMMQGGLQKWLWDLPPSPDDQNHKVRLAWGGPFPVNRPAFEERFGLKTGYCFGMSDMGMCSYQSITEPEPPNSCGKILKDLFDVRIVDDDDEELPTGEVGEIVVRPLEPHIIIEQYFGMPEYTLQAFRNLWFHTGDVGYFDKDGYLFFLERKKQVIKHGGENILPTEVEEGIHSHPEVEFSAVIGVPNDAGEEDVRAFVQLRPGGAVTAEELRDHCSERMAKWMVPASITILDELPMTTTGKPALAELREMGS